MDGFRLPTHGLPSWAVGDSVQSKLSRCTRQCVGHSLQCRKLCNVCKLCKIVHSWRRKANGQWLLAEDVDPHKRRFTTVASWSHCLVTSRTWSSDISNGDAVTDTANWPVAGANSLVWPKTLTLSTSDDFGQQNALNRCQRTLPTCGQSCRPIHAAEV